MEPTPSESAVGSPDNAPQESPDDVPLGAANTPTRDADAAETATPPYQYDDSELPALIALLDDASANADGWLNIASALREQAPTHGFARDARAVCELELAFLYRVSVPHNDSTSAEAPLGPLVAPRDGGFVFPRPIRSVDPGTKALWAALASVTTHAAARARLHDLLFLVREGRPRDHADTAIRSYLDCVGGPLDAHDEVAALCRAWTLARTVKAEADEITVRLAMKQHADLVLSSSTPAPGYVLPLLRALCVRPRSSVRTDPPDEEVIALLGCAGQAFPAPYLQTEVASLIRGYVPGTAAADAASRSEIEAFLREAEAASVGQLRMHHFKTAAERARALGVRDLEEQAIAGMQAIKPDDLEWITIQSESSLPAHVREQYVRQFDEAHDWREALYRFLSTEAPTGRYETNRITAERSVKSTLLRNLFPSSNFGAHGLPQTTASTDEQKLDHEIAQLETMNAELLGNFLADGLNRIRDAFGTPPQPDIEAFLLETFRCDPRLARAFANALLLYWAEEYDASVHLAVPKIEAGVRALLLLLDEPVYRVEVGNTPGQFPGLGALLAHLVDADFDPDWERFISTYFLVRGNNLRNLVAHGFVLGTGPVSAALCLRACGLLTSLVPQDAASADRAMVLASLAVPTRQVVRFPLAWWTRSRFLARCHRRLVQSRSWSRN